MNTPVVSVCIPAFRAASFIRETLDSVRAQTFEEWELLVTEDGSDDGTEAIVRDFARTVSQPVHFERHPENRGLPATRNTSIAAARGEWIALLDSDDLWTPDHLRAALACAHRTQADLVHSGAILFDSDTGRVMEVRVPSPALRAAFPRSLFCGDYIIQPSSVMLRRQLWERVGGFDPSFRYVEDREMWIRCIRAGAVVAFSEVSTCRYRQHPSALSRHAAAMALANARVFERNADWDALPRDLRRDQAAAAWTSVGRIVLKNDPRSARDFFRRALRHRLLAPATFVYWFAALLLGFTRGKTV